MPTEHLNGPGPYINRGVKPTTRGQNRKQESDDFEGVTFENFAVGGFRSGAGVIVGGGGDVAMRGDITSIDNGNALKIEKGTRLVNSNLKIKAEKGES